MGEHEPWQRAAVVKGSLSMSTKLFAATALSALLMTLGAGAQAQDAMSADPMADSMAADAMMAPMGAEDLAKMRRGGQGDHVPGCGDGG